MNDIEYEILFIIIMNICYFIIIIIDLEIFYID